MLFFIAYCDLSQLLLKPFFKQLVKDRSSPELIEKTAEKAVDNIHRMIYYIVSTIWGYKVLRENTDWLPVWMGGHETGVLQNVLHVYPWKSWPQPILDYSLYTSGFHFAALFLHILRNRKSSGFQEFLLHHIATCALFFGYIYGNLMHMGTIIAWLHDIADIATTLCKTFDCIGFDIGTYVSFAGVVVSWFVSRLVWLPIIIVGIARHCLGILPADIKHLNDILLFSFVTFLSTLQVLHVYWFYLFIRIFLNALDGKTGDIQEVPEIDVQNEKKNN